MDQGLAYQSDGVTPLYARIAEAVGAHNVTFAQKIAVREAMAAIPEDERDDMTWEKLPQAARDAIEACEAEPVTSWDDPLDVPDDTRYMD